ncbi:UNVERIFIED_CONTAM: hypothetical protein PYX00_009791 [Menopon gallinae]|uniref:Protein sly1 homolog n=1 Tax=Menopon gallinae TaxID=328185 RepID=A0AAW2HCM7_9NEOP
MVTLRDKQIAALKVMLNLNQPQVKSKTCEPVWKILIYDRYGQDIISPLISVKELRELGVTLHLQLHSDRDTIPDVPAVYFVMPTEENLGRIGQDLQNNLYDFYHLNFISPISRERLEDLAGMALQANAVAHIQKIFDQYLNFITLEDDLFILRQQNQEAVSYYTINRGDIKDSEIENIIDTLVDSLFSVFATLKAVPIIRSPRGNAAEMLAEKLDKKLRDNLKDTRNNLFLMDAGLAGNFCFQRPLLIILDRNVDMATPLHHTWTYQALAHDVLGLNLNRVIIEESTGSTPSGGARAKTKSYQLDPNDKFWLSHKGSPFPTVVEAIQEELEQYRSSEEEVKRLKKSMGIEGDSEEAFAMVNDVTAKLTSTINNLPQLLEKKRLIDVHMTVATEILNAIKSRRLDNFFEYEEKVMGHQVLDKSIQEVLSDREFGYPDDMLRLLLIYYICSVNVSESEIEKCANILREAGCDLSPLSYLKRWKAYTKMAAASSQYQGSGTKTVSMFSKLVSQGSSFVMEGVKNFVVKKHDLPVTRIVDQLMEQKSSSETDDYRYLDPKQLRQGDVSARMKTPFQEAVVFIVGGGNYIEYQNLVDYTKNKTGPSGSKKIIYGASSLNNAKEFLKQLSMLGRELQ